MKPSYLGHTSGVCAVATREHGNSRILFHKSICPFEKQHSAFNNVSPHYCSIKSPIRTKLIRKRTLEITAAWWELPTMKEMAHTTALHQGAIKISGVSMFCMLTMNPTYKPMRINNIRNHSIKIKQLIWIQLDIFTPKLRSKYWSSKVLK